MSDHYNRFRYDEHRRTNQQYQDYDGHNGYGHHRSGHYLMYVDWAKRILQDKTWLMLALIIFLIVLALGIWLLSLLIPLFGQLLGIAEKSGIKGAVEAISPYLWKLWEGASK